MLKNPAFRDALMRQGSFSRVTPVSQVQLRLRNGESIQKIFETARRAALDWLAKKSGRPLPPKAWKGEAFDLQEVGAQPTTVVVLDKPPFWACRNVDADKALPQRTWFTEIALAHGSDCDVLFGCRLHCVTRGEWEPFLPSVPAIVRIVVERLSVWQDRRRLTGSPWTVETDDDIGDLVTLLTLPDRRLPVIGVSLGDREGSDTSGVIDAHALARRVCGAAHVVTLTGEASFKLTDEIGKEFSVFHQAVRTWQPGFDPDRDDPAKHRLTLPGSISQWNGIGPEVFTDFLVEQVLRYSVSGREAEREFPTFARISEAAARQRLESAISKHAPDRELQALYEQEIERLTRRNADEAHEYAALIQEAERERDLHRDEVERITRENSGLRARILTLENALKDSGKAEVIPIPPNFDSLEEWCRNYLYGSVVVFNRAFRAARKSSYSEPELVYKTLLLFKEKYVPMKKGSGSKGMSRAWLDSLADLGLEESGTFAGERAGQFGDEYYVSYEGQRHLLDRHLKRGNSRDQRYCFRLYFHWHEESGQVLIGSFPSHLTTGIT